MQAAQATWGSDWLSPRPIDHCKEWIYCVKQGREIAKQTKNYMEVSYEDFFADGQQTLRSVFAWMGVERTPAECDDILKRHSIEKLQSGAVPGTPWNLAAEPQGFIRSGVAQGWRNELSPHQVYLVEAMTKDVMPMFGYQPISRTGLTLQLVSFRLVQFRERIRAGLHRRLRRLWNRIFPYHFPHFVSRK
jgi:hypothetical protein